MVSAQLIYKQNTSKHCDGKDNNNNINIVWSETLPVKNVSIMNPKNPAKDRPGGKIL